MAHLPVLLQSTIESLNLKPGSRVLDATLGNGGHALLLSEKIGPSGLLVGLDADAESLKRATATLKNSPTPTHLIQANFRDLEKVMTEAKLGPFEAILFDLGWSSDQLEMSGRGFSFLRDEPLLMTLNNQPLADDTTAYTIVNDWSEESLSTILTGFGEERFAKAIAKAIVTARAEKPIKSTFDLVAIIEASVPIWYQKRKINSATKTFQALRMAVNSELDSLSAGLVGAWNVLSPGGRLAVISFHSLEARLVKNFFRAKVISAEASLVSKHVIKPERTEVLSNPRSRSAQLRVLKKN
ncbi:MAG: 16S rRNA (cytosine(1402)-N(4))-methyltransferase [Candidatus Vogelbacteria bacterium CG22_combo_CG10-13_8_21_14_all_37_9]|uniref:Ribosomal RNA small subunit methyltransferase H n=1 Tax=Candidatus Vogelbacteria bacterium CG22_combo_CG10-13_8_21_14_all_37_9 TaxID=1975046 RepID=A0A2H0BLC9_9BACT|nr:MAG: 16S rRNA (cytosine(1402)-N(4))-methyltransferase [bacterium CG10_37_50]PIP58477.1 MAG: 16S rRNA (cytosine(1402)-N(4))-methyltransferase [Candidatus Vogelbacteria bacterium CG22_combo_CG10-13_8_21_14_all_37_9]